VYDDWTVVSIPLVLIVLASPAKIVAARGMIENRYSRRSIAHCRTRVRSTIRTTHSHTVFVLIALLALAVQTLLVQPHIHLQTVQRTYIQNGIALTKNTAPGIEVQFSEQLAPAPRDGYPVNTDPSNCPLCQELSHSFVHSAGKLVATPIFVTAKFIIFQKWRSLSLAASHIWQGRAPPQR
jgi:hypothetical protein